ncbi:MAG: sulfite exporter TauE/SafE family protein [Roseinatronobacter sp.]
MFDLLMGGLAPATFWLAALVAVFAGLVKGALGFAMPMIMISAYGSLMPIELALAGLILPTLVTNLSQAFRQGWHAALGSMRLYWRMLAVMVLCLLISAQFLTFLPRAVLLVLLGGPIVAYALLQLANIPNTLRVEKRLRAEWMSGAIGGLYGGVSGVWGPPVMIYLLSIGTTKHDMVRILGVVFLIGAMALVLGHSMSGALDARGWGFSAAMVAPSVFGLLLGYKIQDRLDAERFRRWTLILLILTGLNLLRQAVS